MHRTVTLFRVVDSGVLLWEKIEILCEISCNFMHTCTVLQCVIGSVLLKCREYLATWALVVAETFGGRARAPTHFSPLPLLATGLHS